MKRMSKLRNSVANDTVPEDEAINHQTGSDGKSDDTASSQGALGRCEWYFGRLQDGLLRRLASRASRALRRRRAMMK